MSPWRTLHWSSLTEIYGSVNRRHLMIKQSLTSKSALMLFITVVMTILKVSRGDHEKTDREKSELENLESRFTGRVSRFAILLFSIFSFVNWNIKFYNLLFFYNFRKKCKKWKSEGWWEFWKKSRQTAKSTFTAPF